MDTRPIQVAFQNQGAILKDGANAVFGILGRVRIIGEAMDSKERLTEEIMSRARAKLSENGFEVLAFRSTQLSVAGLPQGAE